MIDDDLIKVATRYAVISEILANVAKGMNLSCAIKKMTKTTRLDHNGKPLKPSRRTLYRWIKAFKNKGIDGLRNNPRTMTSPSRVLTPKFIDFMVAQKENDKDASIPEIIRRAYELRIIESAEQVCRSSVWRAARRLNLPIFADKGVTKGDMRRFAYTHRLQMVLCDGKHFRAGIKRLKRVVMTFLDDATRFGLHAVVGTSESTELFVRGLWETVRKWGILQALFVDNGSGFISEDTHLLCYKLDIGLIHGTAAYPEGHGKIERFHGTLIQDLLRSYDSNAAIDPDCAALEMRINHYLSRVYNMRSHEGIDNISPQEKFLSDTLALRPIEDEQSLREKLVVWEKRRVSRDNVISVAGIFYEMPSGYAGRIVKACRHLLDGTLFIIHEGKNIEIFPVDLAFNAQTGAQRSPKLQKRQDDLPIVTPIRTSASMRFDKDFGPIVSPDGDFHQPIKE